MSGPEHPKGRDEDQPSALGAFVWWLTYGLQRLAGAGVLLLFELILVAVVVAAVPRGSVDKFAGLTGVVGGFCLFFGAAAAPTLGRQLGRPSLALAIVSLPYIVLRIARDTWWAGMVGIFLGLWLLTLVEFGLRGLSKPGVSGDSSVSRPITTSNERSPWRIRVSRPEGGTSLYIVAHAGLVLEVASGLLLWFRT